jgi:hypothetical protein
MAKLTARSRNAMADRVFGLPKQRKYPINDRRHAGLAKGYAEKEEKQGKLSPASEKKIISKANRFLASHPKRTAR